MILVSLQNAGNFGQRGCAGREAFAGGDADTETGAGHVRGYGPDMAGDGNQPDVAAHTSVGNGLSIAQDVRPGWAQQDFQRNSINVMGSAGDHEFRTP